MMSETNQLVMKTLSRREKPRTWGQELRSVGEAGESGDPTCLQVTAEPQIQGAQIQLNYQILSLLGPRSMLDSARCQAIVRVALGGLTAVFATNWFRLAYGTLQTVSSVWPYYK